MADLRMLGEKAHISRVYRESKALVVVGIAAAAIVVFHHCQLDGIAT